MPVDFKEEKQNGSKIDFQPIDFQPAQAQGKSIGQRAWSNLPRSVGNLIVQGLRDPNQVAASTVGLDDVSGILNDPGSIPGRIGNALINPIKSTFNTVMHPGESFAEDPAGTTVTLGSLAFGVAGAGRAAAGRAAAMKPYIQNPGVRSAAIDMIPYYGSKINKANAAIDAVRTPPPLPEQYSPWSGKNLSLPTAPRISVESVAPFGEGRSTGTGVSLPTVPRITPTPEPSQWSGQAVSLPNASPRPPEPSQWSGQSVSLPSRVSLPASEIPVEPSGLPQKTVIPEGVPTRPRIKPSEGSHLDLSTETPTTRDYQASARKTWGAHMDRTFRMRGLDANALGQMTPEQVNAIAKELGLNPSSPEKLLVLMENLTKNPVVKQ